MNSFDVAVIGGGSAGYAAARTAHEAGAKVAIIGAENSLARSYKSTGQVQQLLTTFSQQEAQQMESEQLEHFSMYSEIYGISMPRALSFRTTILDLQGRSSMVV